MIHTPEFLINFIETELCGPVYKSLEAKPEELYEPIRYTIALGGKRMRPALVLMAAELFGADYLKAVSPALAIELFHNFSLVHDDVMDKAPLRRAQPSVYTKWNPDIALLSGDAMLVKSYELLMGIDDSYLRKVLEVFNKTALDVCEGQQWDMNFEQRNDVTVDEYIHMITLKTSALLAGSLKIGALMADAAEENLQLIYSFGRNMGIAFQLQDDILDVYGDRYKVGKQTGGDILANKKTFLLLKALELAKGDTLTRLNHWLSLTPKEADVQKQKILTVKEIYSTLNVKELAEKEMNLFYEAALGDLDKINVEESHKKYLKEFADQLMVREY